MLVLLSLWLWSNIARDIDHNFGAFDAWSLQGYRNYGSWKRRDMDQGDGRLHPKVKNAADSDHLDVFVYDANSEPMRGAIS